MLGCGHTQGKVENGEGDCAALRRELTEELDIEIRSPKHLGTCKVTDEGRNVQLVVYLCRQWSGTPQAVHGQTLAWLTPTEARTRPGLPGVEPVEEMLTKDTVKKR